MRPAGTTAVVTGSFPAVVIAVAIASGAAGMVGVYLDTAWHRTVGRDSFFIPPHVFIYCRGLGVLGAALTSVARATLGRAEDFGGPILRLRRLRLPLGFAVTALGIFVIMDAARSRARGSGGARCWPCWWISSTAATSFLPTTRCCPTRARRTSTRFSS